MLCVKQNRNEQKKTKKTTLKRGQLGTKKLEKILDDRMEVTEKK